MFMEFSISIMTKHLCLSFIVQQLGHVINCTVMVLDELDKPLLVSQLEFDAQIVS